MLGRHAAIRVDEEGQGQFDENDGQLGTDRILARLLLDEGGVRLDEALGFARLPHEIGELALLPRELLILHGGGRIGKRQQFAEVSDFLILLAGGLIGEQ